MSSKTNIKHVDSILENQLDDIHKLIRQLSTGAKLVEIERFNSLISSEGIVFFIAEDGAKIIGMLSLVYFKIPTGLRARIEDVVVDDSYRRQGIAESMSGAAIEHYKNSGARSLDLTSSPSREAANKLYLKLGFNLRDTNIYRYSG